MKGVVLLLWLAVSGLAGADSLEFRTHPPGASVYQGGKLLGKTPLALESEPIEVEVRLDGHHSRRVFLNSEEATRPIRLHPDNSVVAVRDALWSPAWLVLLTLVAVMAALARHLGRKRTVHHEVRRAVEDTLAGSQGGKGEFFAKTVEGYQLFDTLGQGGMATVYRAMPRDTLDPKQTVAIKIIAETISDKPDFQARFQREATICQKLTHPNIVRILSWGQHKGRFYLVLEYVEGKTVADILEQGPLPHHYLKILFEALEYAHAQGIVHRDLKPDNLMVTRDGNLKVMDFGLAKSEDSTNLTRTGTTLGTPAYRAPEQIQNADIDHRTDQYALGMVAYQVLAGRGPFDYEEPMKLLFAQMTEQPSPPSHFHPEVSPSVDRVVLRMLSKDKKDRYPTTAEAGQSLWEALQESL